MFAWENVVIQLKISWHLWAALNLKLFLFLPLLGLKREGKQESECGEWWLRVSKTSMPLLFSPLHFLLCDFSLSCFKSKEQEEEKWSPIDLGMLRSLGSNEHVLYC